ncbi:MAG TPA: hypothetical protein VFB59_01390 [Candidatus Saccharimonadales bacterium]|nr:hypothetical protein [Candidatus Saccharimonadales bacterium]
MALNIKTEWQAYGMYALVALAVMLPLLRPGFILTLDMVFTPTLHMPESVTASWPFHALLYGLNAILPSEIIQKLLLFGIFILAGVGMHRLVRLLQPKQASWGIYFASIFFMLNPFTYSRFMAGQYIVLLGYALLPWFARLLLQYMHRPGLKDALKLGGLATLIGIISIHMLAAVALLSLAALGIVLWRYRSKVKAFAKYGAVALGLFLVLSSYWVVPLALGQSSTAQTIGSFTAADTAAFETRGSNPAVRVLHILRLQGFWGESTAQFLLPQQVTILWGLLTLAILGLVIMGLVVLWRQSKPLAVFFGTSLLVAILMAAGLAPLPPGLREPHKMVAVVALGYAAFAAFGVDMLLRWLREKTETAFIIGAVAILIVPFLFMRVMLWGFHGQLVPRHYPAEWATLNQQLAKDTSNSAVLFLPWYQYLSFDFSGRIIANPAPAFFDKEIIASTDPEFGGAVSSHADPRETTIKNILNEAKTQPNLAEHLAAQNIKYILLAKEVDYQQYDFIVTQPGIEQMLDNDRLTLYQNTFWKETQ